jgi:hypothetical protein
MKEMAKYLWPKVHRLSLSSNADVWLWCRTVGVQKSGLVSR